MLKNSIIAIISNLVLLMVGYAQSPVMGKVPRWSGGYGFQVFSEYRHNADLFQGRNIIGKGLTEDISLLHVDGVYTWDKSIRIAIQLPILLYARREVLDASNNVVTQRDRGIGDITLALPLKKYFNLDARSGNWTLAPRVKIPLASADGEDYSFFDRAWGIGLKLGYETETPYYYFGTSFGGWFFSGSEPEELSYSIAGGLNFDNGDSVTQITFDVQLHYESDKTFSVNIGPTIYRRITDEIHFLVSWHHEIYTRQGGIDHGNRNTIKMGVGFVF